MTDNKPVTTGPTIHQEIKRFSSMKVQEYTTTLYDVKGKLLDDGIDLDTDRSYWEAFIDFKQAAELDRRLAMVEAEEWEPGELEFEQMEDTSE